MKLILNKKVIFSIIAILFVAVTVFFWYNGKNDGKKNDTVSLLVDGKEYGEALLIEDDYIKSLPTPPEIEGYVFDYWEYNGIKFDISMPVEPGSTIKAVYKDNPEFITVIVKYDNGLTDAKIKVKKGEAIERLENPTKDNYVFTGWFNNDKPFDISSTVNEDITITAKWSKSDYKVTLHNNLTGEETTLDVSYGSTYSSLPTLTKEGYTFMGWYPAPASGDEITNSTIVTEKSAHTLFGRFSGNTCKVTLHNNATNEETTIDVLYGSTYSNLPIPTQEGYTFMGWYTAPTSGNLIKNTTKVTTTASHTLYARFSNNQYKVTLHNNVTGEETTMNVTYRNNYGILPTPTQEGYTFMGWYPAPASGDEITRWTAVTKTSDHTLYARFGCNTYKVTLHNNVTGEESIIDVSYGTTYNNLPTLTKEGYTFMGWYPAPASGDEITNSTMVTTAANHTLYARFGCNNYKVTLHNNANGEETIIDVSYGTAYNNLPILTREGYTFMGWYPAPASGEEVTNSTIVTTASNHTLYGRWLAD